MITSAIAQYIIHEDTYSRGRYWHWFKTPLLCWIFPIIGLFMLFIGLSLLINEDESKLSYFLIIFFGIYFIFRYWIIGFRFRRELRKNPYYGNEVKWIFTEDGFETMTKGSEMKAAWSGLYEVFITPDGLLIYPQKRLYYWIPKSAFSNNEEIRFVEEILDQKTKSKRIG